MTIEVYSAVQQAFDTYLQTIAGLPHFVAEDEQYRADLATPFMRVKMFPATTQVLTLTRSGYYTVNGVYQVGVFFPAGGKAQGANAAVDLLFTAFPRTLVLSANDLDIHIERVSRVVGITDAAWYQVPVQIRFYLFVQN